MASNLEASHSGGLPAGLAVQRAVPERDDEAPVEATTERTTTRARLAATKVASNAALGAVFGVPGLVIGLSRAAARSATKAVKTRTAEAADVACSVTAVRVERLRRINTFRKMSPYVCAKLVRLGDGAASKKPAVRSGRTAALHNAGDSFAYPAHARFRCVVGLDNCFPDAGGTPATESWILVLSVKDEPELALVGAARSAAGRARDDDPFLVGTAAVGLQDLLADLGRPGASETTPTTTPSPSPRARTSSCCEVNLGLTHGPAHETDAGLLRVRIELTATLRTPDDEVGARSCDM
mmetsp:Transcript_1012/g.4018  ORF Transcript_1012/g.4018 Transcript_1012/m.4018 type:complete len:296 (-) Transcript_1012:412-1299(-)